MLSESSGRKCPVRILIFHDLLLKLRVIWKVITKVWYNDVIDINVSKNYIGSGLRYVY